MAEPNQAEKQDNLQQAPSQSAEASSNAPEAIHEDLSYQQKDLAEFTKETSENKKNDQETLNKIAQLNNPTPANIIAMRRGAGINQAEDEKDTLKKYTRLASAFLEQAPEQGKIAYTVDFKNNTTAEKFIGIGDLVPPNVESVMVKDDNGNVVSNKATRNINNKNRVGYFDEKSGEYIAVHTGYRIIVLSTRTDTARKLAEENSDSFRADPTLARRKMREHLSIFQTEKPNITREDLHVGLNNRPPASATQQEIQENDLPPPAPEQSPATREVVSTGGLSTQGYKRAKKVTPAVTQEALRCLKKGGPIGTTHYLEIDGTKYAFHREIHKHPPGDCPPLPSTLCGNHHGISVFAA